MKGRIVIPFWRGFGQIYRPISDTFETRSWVRKLVIRWSFTAKYFEVLTTKVAR